jgi:hypothetical protein
MLPLRSTLTRYSTSPHILFLSALPTYCPCLPAVLRQARSTRSCTTKKMKTLPKVRPKSVGNAKVHRPILDATELDFWVMEQLRALIANASANSVLDAQLRQEKTVFFLHLLGLDTTGHSYRPHSVVSRTSPLNMYVTELQRVGIHEQHSSCGQDCSRDGAITGVLLRRYRNSIRLHC